MQPFMPQKTTCYVCSSASDKCCAYAVQGSLAVKTVMQQPCVPYNACAPFNRLQSCSLACLLPTMWHPYRLRLAAWQSFWILKTQGKPVVVGGRMGKRASWKDEWGTCSSSRQAVFALA